MKVRGRRTLQRQQCFQEPGSETRTVFSTACGAFRCADAPLGGGSWVRCCLPTALTATADVRGCVGLTRQSEQDHAPTDVQSLVPFITIITRCLCDRIHAQMRQVLVFTAVCVCVSVNMCRGTSACSLCIYCRGSSCTQLISAGSGRADCLHLLRHSSGLGRGDKRRRRAHKG